MLKLKKVNKSYKSGSLVHHALIDIDLELQRGEFVSILGPSGSGKTTLLNVIGGLDRYDSGDLIINDKSTKDFKDKHWDYYRNNLVGFIFQNYNLINHISVLDNVMLSLTLSGLSGKKRRRKAISALDKVGLKEHIHKKPNQLSGGQMQRVAIARCIVNDPDIILADEPTGALDSKTSIQIMKLIKEISKDKLVIMVTHNSSLAKEYSTRILELSDGKIVKDSGYKKKDLDKKEFKIKKTSMNFLEALKLSFNNIITKKGRTFLTSFASSVGIIGIALILSLSNGFDKQIDIFEKDTLSSMPIIISTSSSDVSMDSLKDNNDKKKLYPSDSYVYLKDESQDKFSHVNNIKSEYIDYVKNIDTTLLGSYTYFYSYNMNVFSRVNDSIKKLDITKFMPIPVDVNGKSFLKDNYDLLYGSFPRNNNEILLLVNNKNEVDKSILSMFGYDNMEKVSFDKIINKEFKVVNNNDYYINNGTYFNSSFEYDKLYNSINNRVLNVVGIVRVKSDNSTFDMGSLILYNNNLMEDIINDNSSSDIVVKQREVNYNVLTGELFTDDLAKEEVLSLLGGTKTPNMIYLYPNDFDSKDKLVSYLDKYNDGKSIEEKIVYTDLAKTISSLSSNIMGSITIVLICFSGISLVVSSIMIGIITYISVLERTKEIGILRSLGARKKDITRVFTAEVFLIGLFSGVMGILITYLLLVPVNSIIYSLTNLKGVAVLSVVHAIILVVISIILTLIGGIIPSKMASKKDPVKALRSN